MKDTGFHPNATTYDILVSGHGKIGDKKESGEDEASQGAHERDANSRSAPQFLDL